MLAPEESSEKVDPLHQHRGPDTYKSTGYDLGARVSGLGVRDMKVRRPWGACWMVAEGGEGENPLPFSLTAPKRGGGGGGGGGGGRGGIPASFPSRSPPPKQPFQPTPTPSRPRGLRNLRGFCGEKAPGPWRAGPQALGARAPRPLETWPTGPWGLDPATLTDFLQAKFNFLLRLKPMGPGLKTLP